MWYKLNFEPCPFFASHRHSSTEGLSVAPTTHSSLREQRISGPKSLPAKWEDRVRWQILRMQNLVQSKSKKLLLRSQMQKVVLACLSFFEVEIVAAFLPQTHHFMQYSFFWAAITAITFNESMSQCLLSLPFGSRPKVLGSRGFPGALASAWGFTWAIVSHAAAESLTCSCHEETLRNDSMTMPVPQMRGFYFLVMPWRSGSPQWLWDFWVKILVNDAEDLLLPYSRIVRLAPKLLLLRLNRASIEVS